MGILQQWWVGVFRLDEFPDMLVLRDLPVDGQPVLPVLSGRENTARGMARGSLRTHFVGGVGGVFAAVEKFCCGGEKRVFRWLVLKKAGKIWVG